MKNNHNIRHCEPAKRAWQLSLNSMRLPRLAITSLAVAVLLLACSNPQPENKPKLCPDWSSNSLHNYSNKDFSNFACATNNNIYEQVSNKDDLVKGHGQQVLDGDRESVEVQKYMTGAGAAASGGSSGGSSSR